MRVIKVRAWNHSVKRMSKAVTLKELYETELVQFHNLTFLQFTGLKDKNGVEICEGDIMKEKEGRYHYLVRFILGSFCLDAGSTPYIHDVIRERGGVEVIGNIYENPELLEKP